MRPQAAATGCRRRRYRLPPQVTSVVAIPCRCLFEDNREGLVLLIDAIEKAGYTGKIKIGMDVAASEFFTKDGKYDLNFKKQPNDGTHVLIAQNLCELYKDFVFS
ncbi:hypothetical protein L1049_027402 [Liquidambar formosana]|uniref:phosphopyruvate hydratase n=1 Tax=Liquidambar formosana TaxID=63359 RepID=A0AAP0RH65_LIQFO